MSVLRLLRSAFASVVLAAGVLVALEGALRLAGWPDPGLYAGDPASLWTLRPGLAARPVPFRERGTTFAVRTSTAGYRGAEPEPGALLCLGDSTTFGWGVEEDEAWPARLAARLGTRVTNGGVPGYSTVQGLATLDQALATHPRAVIVAYLVRDAEKAMVPDRLRPTPPRAPDLQLVRALRALRPPPAPPPGTTFRVPPLEYGANVRTLVDRIRADGAVPYVLAFPMVDPPAAHLAALGAVGDAAPVWAPTLPADAYFAEDPIHLTPTGNDRLAELVAAALAGASMPVRP